MIDELTRTSPAPSAPRIESLLSNRLFLAPQLAGDRLYFISNLSGRLSLFAMDWGGSVPEPLLPADIALQTPDLLQGHSFCAFPQLGRILIMIDRDGDERYQPMLIPLEGGIPEPAFGDSFAQHAVHLGHCDLERNIVYLIAESRQEALFTAFRAHLDTRELEKLGESPFGSVPEAISDDQQQIVMVDFYTPGDHVLFLRQEGQGDRRPLYGKPMDLRTSGDKPQMNGIHDCHFTRGGNLLFITALFDDSYSLGWLDPANPAEVRPIRTSGIRHTGAGELTGLEHLRDSRYQLTYNIDGASWAYEGTLDEAAQEMRLDMVLCGEGELAGGVLEGLRYDRSSDRYALSFSTAISPTQLYTLGSGPERRPRVHTRERILGIPKESLSPGEDASFTSHDGLRCSARLYIPAAGSRSSTGSGWGTGQDFTAPFPLVYYIHGGPQGQERPDFAWFSMPLIQFLTLNGFAVFVPNVRGSTGYGQEYANRVNHDWGGLDTLDHVHAMKVLAEDERIDTERAGVMGRSYGGYMTLTLAARHPQLWKAAVDMFGPYDMLTFFDRMPESWKPMAKLFIGDPETERDFVLSRSPRTYVDNISCPLYVIQGKNDPRVVEQESADLVEHLRSQGKKVEYLVFENEGHDVIKFENKVRCYTAITEFFREHL